MLKNILLIFLLSLSSFAQLDFDVNSFTRSYPLGFFINGDLGYSFNLWDKRTPTLPLYGYVRPSVKLQNSGPVNSGSINIDFAPISILVFYAGRRFVNRDLSKLHSFDCQIVVCRDQMTRDYIGLKFAIKYRNFVMLNDHRLDSIELKDKTGAFAEEMGSLVGQGPKDRLLQNTIYMHYELSSEKAIGLIQLYSSMKNIGNSSRMHIGFFRYQAKTWSLFGGPGVFHGRDGHNHFTSMLMFKYIFEKGQRVF